MPRAKKLTTLERIQRIIDEQIAATERESKTGTLDRHSAANMVDFTKLIVLLDKHQMEHTETVEAEKVAQKLLDDLKKNIELEAKRKAKQLEREAMQRAEELEPK